jgi:hypothetical protein
VKTEAPTELSAEDRAVVADWMHCVCPAVEAELDSRAETCLAWYRDNGRRQVNWGSVVIGWIKRDLNRGRGVNLMSYKLAKAIQPQLEAARRDNELVRIEDEERKRKMPASVGREFAPGQMVYGS